MKNVINCIDPNNILLLIHVVTSPHINVSLSFVEMGVLFSDDVLYYLSLCIVDFYWRIFKSFSELHRFSLLSPINELYFCNPLRCFRSVLGGLASLAFSAPFSNKIGKVLNSVRKSRFCIKK